MWEFKKDMQDTCTRRGSVLTRPSSEMEHSQHAASAQSAQEPPSFEAQFLEHWTYVYRTLARLVGDPAEAEDLALETFLRLYQRPPACDNAPSLRGWLRRVALNLGLDAIRGRQRRARYEEEAGLILAMTHQAASLGDEIARREEQRQVRHVLGQMNRRQAELLTLRAQGLPYREIAATLGVSPTSIGPLLVRAEREFEHRYLECEGKVKK